MVISVEEMEKLVATKKKMEEESGLEYSSAFDLMPFDSAALEEVKSRNELHEL